MSSPMRATRLLPPERPSPELPDGPSAEHNPYVVDQGEHRALYLEESQIQSLMLRHDPVRLLIDYTRMMMGFLLWVPTPERVAIIGLGGGSLVKYLRHHLPETTVEVAELSAAVIALRAYFEVPPDGPRLRIAQAEGAAFVKAHPGGLDALLVDGFDGNGLAPTLCTPEFYRSCHDRLGPGGVLSVNLPAEGAGYGAYVRRIREVFGTIAVIPTDDESNKVVLAWRGPTPAPEVLRERGASLTAVHPLELPSIAERVILSRSRHG